MLKACQAKPRVTLPGIIHKSLDDMQHLLGEVVREGCTMGKDWTSEAGNTPQSTFAAFAAALSIAYAARVNGEAVQE